MSPAEKAELKALAQAFCTAVDLDCEAAFDAFEELQNRFEEIYEPEDDDDGDGDDDDDEDEDEG